MEAIKNGFYEVVPASAAFLTSLGYPASWGFMIAMKNISFSITTYNQLHNCYAEHEYRLDYLKL